MPSTGKLEDLVLRGPAFAPLNGDPFRGLASQPDMIPLADPRRTASNLGMQHPSIQLLSRQFPSRQLSSMQQPRMKVQRSNSSTYGAPGNQHSSQLRPLQSALGSARRMLPTATRYVKYGTKAKRPTPLVLPEPPQLPPMLSSPFTPFSSGISPAVPPKSGDYMSPFTPPLRESAPKPPPVPPKDNFNSLTHGTLRSAIPLRPYLVRYPDPQLAARYPQESLRPILDYEEMEDLALDPEERQNANVPFSVPVHHWPLPMESSSGPSTAMVAGSEDVEMKSLPMQISARSKRLPNRCHCDCHTNNLSDAATADSAESQGQRTKQKPQAEVRSRKKAIVKASKKSTKMKKGDAARLTALANAGKSGYAPHTKRPKNQPWPVDENGKMYPIQVVYPYTKAAKARDRAAGIYASSEEDTDDE
jgi:hypothetical protein